MGGGSCRSGKRSRVETLNRLAGDWKIYQLKGGHRFSIDDLMTAWTAWRARPRCELTLDLGCGIGSVGLLTLWKLPSSARLVGVEVQEASLELARRTVALNGLSNRVELCLGDLRELRYPGLFPLITGSPPYFPVSKAVVSPHPQRAGARAELKGDVFDYCRAAALHLAPDGAFCFCHAAADPRPEQAVEAAGLKVLQRQDVVFRGDQPPLVALFTCAREGARQPDTTFVARGKDGRWTDEYLTMRAEMGTVVWNKP